MVSREAHLSRDDLQKELDQARRRVAELEAVENELERVRAELYRTQAILTAAIEQAPAGFVIADAPGRRVRLVSRTALKLMGRGGGRTRDVPVEEHVKGWQIIKPDGTVVSFDDRPLERAVSRGETVENLEAAMRGADGQTRHVCISARPVRDENGLVVAGVAVFHDVSATKALESERVQTLSFFAHDMKSPLAGLIGFARLLLSGRVGALNARQREYLETAASLAERVYNLAVDFLDVARLCGSGFDLPMEPVDLAALCRPLCREYRQRAVEAGLSFREDIRPPLPPIRGNPGRLTRVLANLLDNAIKYSRRGEVSLSIRTDGDGRVTLEVADQGPGLSKADLARLFSTFYRGEAGRGVEGTGLGLAAVKAIIEAHGGAVAGGNRPGGGAVFTISLPVMAG